MEYEWHEIGSLQCILKRFTKMVERLETQGRIIKIIQRPALLKSEYPEVFEGDILSLTLWWIIFHSTTTFLQMKRRKQHLANLSSFRWKNFQSYILIPSVQTFRATTRYVTYTGVKPYHSFLIPFGQLLSKNSYFM